MANAYVNVYKDNPTESGTDGTAVSTGGTYTSPISFTLNASQNESQTVKLAIRTESGYVYNNATITDVGDTNDRMKLCKTENGTFTDSITFEQITATNQIFYARASSANTENPQTDRSVSFNVSGELAAV